MQRSIANELEKLKNYYSQKKNKGAMYITPHGTALVNTKGGLYPVDRHGNISKKRQFIMMLDGDEVWQIKRKNRRRNDKIIIGG